jgi:xanthine dehydrogenase accessory factor
MSLDLDALRAAVADQGRVTRVLILAHQGSSPREAGTAMLVWQSGQAGTIGGGALEWEAAARARAATAPEVVRVPLGPGLGQCCGGAVRLVFEPFDAARLASLTLAGGLAARPLAPGDAEPPLAVRRLLATARGQGLRAGPRLVDGWLVEPLAAPTRHLWVWGAGHVGRAIVAVAAPLPGVGLTWIDTAAGRFPEAIPAGVSPRVAADPTALVSEAPATADHLILTFSHALDLALCHALLSHGFGSAGLIGSATKWARFRSRLAALGHGPAAIDRIRCPIGDPALGKHPQAIAIGAVAELLRPAGALQPARQDEAG